MAVVWGDGHPSVDGGLADGPFAAHVVHHELGCGEVFEERFIVWRSDQVLIGA